MVNRLNISLLFILLAVLSFGQNFQTQVSSTQIAEGDRLKVSYALDGSGQNFRAPKFNGFQTISGPNQSSSMSWVNGKMSSKISYSFILVALKQGTYTIPGAKITVDGKELTSNNVSVKVVKGSPPQTSTNSNSNTKAPSNEIKENLFIKVFADKRKAYVGEQIIVTYKVYTRLNIVNNGINKLPDFNGFWAQDIESPQIGRLEQTSVNGVAFNVATIKKSVLIPQRTGKLEIDPLIMDVVVRVRDNKRPRSMFDQFFGSFRDVNFQISSNTFGIEVTPLPEPKPRSYSGAVGNFKINANIDKDSVSANEAINYKVTFSGAGNIKFIGTPKIDFPPDFEIYDPKVSEKVNVSGGGINGSKTFEYLMIPRHGGEFSIPEFEFSYFNPKSKTYEKLNTPNFQIQVGKSQNEEEAIFYRSVKQEEIKLLGQDIRFIKTGVTKLVEKDQTFFNSGGYYAGLIAPSLAFLLFLFLTKNKQLSQTELVAGRSKKAAKLAGKKLNTAKQALAAGNKKEFYEKLLSGLYDYFSDKFNIPVADLSTEKISESIASKSANKELVEKTKEVLSTCEMARFAPVTTENESETYAKANQLIQDIEKAI